MMDNAVLCVMLGYRSVHFDGLLLVHGSLSIQMS